MDPLATTSAPAPTHGCVRCGAPIPIEDAMCERCNPLGLPQPAASQAHGTVFLAIAVGVVGLALLGRFALAGIGPFTATVTSVSPASDAVSVAIQVTNQGSRAGEASCRIYDPSAGIGPDTLLFQTGSIAAGATVELTEQVTEYGSQPRTLIAQCTGP